MSMGSTTPESTYVEMFRPPVNRAMRVLDRTFFQKKIPITAAVVPNLRKIAKLKSELDCDALKLERMQSILLVKDSHGQEGKGLLLRSEIKKDGKSSKLS